MVSLWITTTCLLCRRFHFLVAWLGFQFCWRQQKRTDPKIEQTSIVAGEQRLFPLFLFSLTNHKRYDWRQKNIILFLVESFRAFAFEFRLLLCAIHSNENQKKKSVALDCANDHLVFMEWFMVRVWTDTKQTRRFHCILFRVFKMNSQKSKKLNFYDSFKCNFDFIILYFRTRE